MSATISAKTETRKPLEDPECSAMRVIVAARQSPASEDPPARSCEYRVVAS